MGSFDAARICAAASMADSFFSFGSLVFLAFVAFSTLGAASPTLASSASFFVANCPCSAPPSLGTTQNRPLPSFLTCTVGLVAFAPLVAFGALVVFLDIVKLL